MASGGVARVKLKSSQTQSILKLEDRAPGVYSQELIAEGNSLLSSVFIESSSGGTVEVKYYDTTTGRVELGERYDLNSHDPLSTVGLTDRITVTRIHNKPVIEATVTGANIKFGVYATVVGTFASDLDAALRKHEEDIDFTNHKGLPSMVRDPSDEKFYFLKGNKGCLSIESSTVDEGTSYFKDVQTITTPGVVQTLWTEAVPALTTRKISHLIVTCRMPGVYTLKSGGVIIATGRTGAGVPNDNFLWTPKRPITAGTTLTLEFCATSGRPATDVEAYFMASDVT